MKSLTSVIFKNERRREKISKNGNSAKYLNLLSFLIVFGTLAGFMVWASIYVTNRLREFDQTYAFINMMLFANFGIVFFKSIFEILNVLYFSKDLKILLRMPINAIDIVHSKLLKIITSEYEMELIMLGIPMIVYGIIEKLSVLYFLYIPIILIIVPIIPISITALIVALIMRITNKLKNKSKAMYVTIIISFFVVNFILFFLGGNGFSAKVFENAILQENGLAILIANKLKLIIPIMNTLLNYNNIDGIKNILLYSLISFDSYIISILLISPIYLNGVIGTIINGDKKILKKKIDLKLIDFKQKTPKKSYLIKEYKIIRRSPIFFIQCLLMPILFSISVLIIALFMVAFTRIFGYNIIKEITLRVNQSWGTGAFLSISQIFYMLNFTSIIAISKEEKWAILCKYLPIKLSRQINMKLLIGKISNFIASIAVIFWYYVCTLNLINTIFVLLICFELNIFGEKIKILIDLQNPKINWDNEYTMMKQNTNVMFELFYTMLIIIFLIGIGFILKDLTLYFIIIALTFLIGNIVLSKYIWDNDQKIFDRLY